MQAHVVKSNKWKDKKKMERKGKEKGNKNVQVDYEYVEE